MWIARTADAKEKQDSIQIQKRKMTDTEMTEKKAEMSRRNDSTDSSTEESGVSLELSDEAKKMAETKNTMSFQEYKEMVDNFREQKEGAEDFGKIWSRCMTIAIRIGAGDIVPLKDEKYLQEHEPKLYMSSMTMRMLKEDPEEYDSILEDEEEKKDASGPIASESASGISSENTESSVAVETADIVVSEESTE